MAVPARRIMDRFTRLTLHGIPVKEAKSGTQGAVEALVNAVKVEVANFDKAITKKDDAEKKMPAFRERLLEGDGRISRYLLELRGRGCRRTTPDIEALWGSGVPPPWKTEPSAPGFLSLESTLALEATGVVLDETFKTLPDCKNKAGNTVGKALDRKVQVDNPQIFNNGNAVGVVRCWRCEQPRPIFSCHVTPEQPTVENVNVIQQLNNAVEIFPYDCGSQLLPDGERYEGLRDMFKVEQKFTCAMEKCNTYYYLAKKRGYNDCCHDCGSEEDLNFPPAIYQDGRKCRTQCRDCFGDKDKPATPYGKKPNNVNRAALTVHNSASKSKLMDMFVIAPGSSAGKKGNEGKEVVSNVAGKEVVGKVAGKVAGKVVGKKSLKGNAAGNGKKVGDKAGNGKEGNTSGRELRVVAAQDRKNRRASVLFTYKGLAFLDFDFERLHNSFDYGNDNIMEFGRLLLLDRPELKSTLKSVQLLNSFAHFKFKNTKERIYFKEDRKVSEEERALQHLDRETRQVMFAANESTTSAIKQVFSKNFATVPINSSKHWSLFLICHADLFKKCLDSWLDETLHPNSNICLNCFGSLSMNLLSSGSSSDKVEWCSLCNSDVNAAATRRTQHAPVLQLINVTTHSNNKDCSVSPMFSSSSTAREECMRGGCGNCSFCIEKYAHTSYFCLLHFDSIQGMHSTSAIGKDILHMLYGAWVASRITEDLTKADILGRLPLSAINALISSCVGKASATCSPQQDNTVDCAYFALDKQEKLIENIDKQSNDRNAPVPIVTNDMFVAGDCSLFNSTADGNIGDKVRANLLGKIEILNDGGNDWGNSGPHKRSNTDISGGMGDNDNHTNVHNQIPKKVRYKEPETTKLRERLSGHAQETTLTVDDVFYVGYVDPDTNITSVHQGYILEVDGHNDKLTFVFNSDSSTIEYTFPEWSAITALDVCKKAKIKHVKMLELLNMCKEGKKTIILNYAYNDGSATIAYKACVTDIKDGAFVKIKYIADSTTETRPVQEISEMFNHVVAEDVKIPIPKIKTTQTKETKRKRESEEEATRKLVLDAMNANSTSKWTLQSVSILFVALDYTVRT